VQKQMRSHSRPAEQIRPLEHLPRGKRVKESAFGSSAGASLSKTTLELPARAKVQQLFPSFATEEDAGRSPPGHRPGAQRQCCLLSLQG
jgi:hypothetical protein